MSSGESVESSSSNSTAALLHPGQQLGRYELILPIARGGMAQVWAARQTGAHGFSRIVAIKSILPAHVGEGSFRRMFLDEARIAARLRHSNVVEVLDLGQDGAHLYLVMPLIDGDSVSGLVRKQKRAGGAPTIPIGIAARIMADACAGLHAAHALTDEDGKPLELVHRDVSPHNILVGIDGTSRITDFGIAKALGRIEQTDAGQVKGKFAYMSPEQLRREPLDARSDVFAAGVVLWELLAGERLFLGQDVLETAQRVLELPIPPLAPDVPAAFSELCLRALSRDKRDRFRTIAELRDSLEAAARASGTVTATAEVGAWVSGLIREQIGARHEALRVYVRKGDQEREPESANHKPIGTLTGSGTVSVPSSPPSVRPPARRSIWIAGAGLVMAMGVVIAIWISRPGSPPQAAAQAEESALRPAATVAASSAPVPAEPIAGTAASAAQPFPSASASVAPRPAHRTGSRPATKSSPRVKQPKFANPYSQ
jgi:eukaryotic-like serine/threonine-protein kinase